MFTHEKNRKQRPQSQNQLLAERGSHKLDAAHWLRDHLIDPSSLDLHVSGMSKWLRDRVVNPVAADLHITDTAHWLREHIFDPSSVDLHISDMSQWLRDHLFDLSSVESHILETTHWLTDHVFDASSVDSHVSETAQWLKDHLYDQERADHKFHPPVLDSLEQRVELSTGGGWISGTYDGLSGVGVYGQYFSNAALEGAASTSQWSNRISYLSYNSESPAVELAASQPGSSSAWSARWVGTITANYTESYTFYVNSAGSGMRLWVTPVDQTQGSPVIDYWTQHNQTLNTATITLQSGALYNVELEYSYTTGSVQQVQLQWASEHSPLVDIEPATQIGLNAIGRDALFANMVNASTRNSWWIPNTSQEVPTDAGNWPMADASILLGEGSTVLKYGGSYLFQFKGMATVSVRSDLVNWLVDGVSVGSTLNAGQGYDPVTNTTTATLVVPAGALSNLQTTFTNTSRTGTQGLTINSINYTKSNCTATVSVASVAGLAKNQYVTISGLTGTAATLNGTYQIANVNSSNNTFTFVKYSLPSIAAVGQGVVIANPGNGISDLYVMQPTTLGGSTPSPVGTLFTQSALDMYAQYSALRFLDLSSANNNLTSDWSDRTVISTSFWCANTFNNGLGVNTGVSKKGTVAGVPWEIQVALANATGKDIYINVPSNVSMDYITKLAQLFAYGSDGVTPYTGPVASPIWKPLNSNLKVYIEFSNELWNSMFLQSMSRSNGWTNQLSQRALYDYYTGNLNDSLYPGGGRNAYDDGAQLAAYFNLTESDIAAFLATYNPNPKSATDGGSPSYFSNAGSLTGYTIGQAWVGLRSVQLSNAFKAAFDELGVKAVDSSSRVRPVFMWQYGGQWAKALSFIDTAYGSVNPVNYYLYGGGGGWYADNKAGGFTDVSFQNPDFEKGLEGWSTNGDAGVVSNGSAMGNPDAPPLFSPILATGGAMQSGKTVTIQTAFPHNFSVGQVVTVSGVAISGYNGKFTITSVSPTSFTYEATTTGLGNSGGGMVTGMTPGTKAAYLKPGSSISQNVTFSGGYADITLYLTQSVATDWSRGLTITLTPIDGGPAINDGNPIAVSEGGGSSAFFGPQNAYVWARSSAFFTGDSSYTYKVTFSQNLTSGTCYLSGLAIQTVNGLFKETTAHLLAVDLDVSQTVRPDVNLANRYGLFDVGYEGGYNFSQNLSGYNDLNGYRNMGSRGYSSAIPNVGFYANLDARTIDLALATLDQFYAAGGDLAFMFQSTANMNSWSMTGDTYYEWNSPKHQAAYAYQQASHLPTYGLLEGQPGTSNIWWLNTARANSLNTTVLVDQGNYSLTLNFSKNSAAPAGQTDTIEIILDGRLFATVDVPTRTGGTFVIPVGVLSAGQHSILLVNAAPKTNANVAFGAAGTEVLTLKYLSEGNLPITPSQPKVYWDTPAIIASGTLLDSSHLSAVANVPGTFSYSSPLGTILQAGSFVITVNFTPSDLVHYSAVTTTRLIVVEKMAPRLSVEGGLDTYDGTALPVAVTISGPDGVERCSLQGITPTLTYYVGESPTGNPLCDAPVDAGIYTVVARFEGSADYCDTTVTKTFTINKATPVVSCDIYLSGNELQFSVGSSIPGRFSYSIPVGAITAPAVGQAIGVRFIPEDSLNYATVIKTVFIEAGDSQSLPGSESQTVSDTAHQTAGATTEGTVSTTTPQTTTPSVVPATTPAVPATAPVVSQEPSVVRKSANRGISRAKLNHLNPLRKRQLQRPAKLPRFQRVGAKLR